MTIQLPGRQRKWLDAQIASGRFKSVDEAIELAIARLQTEEAIDDAWAKPLIDAGLTALDRGEGTPWLRGGTLERIKARAK